LRGGGGYKGKAHDLQAIAQHPQLANKNVKRTAPDRKRTAPSRKRTIALGGKPNPVPV
jgi:hypothetical protein